MKYKQETLIPILRSSLPPFERMLPYLNQIESHRCHSNFGKFFRLFEERMAHFFSLNTNEVAIVCNGTLALIATLVALDIPQGKFCLTPSWTFSATPASILMSGLKPLFLDVDLNTQSLTPARVKHFLNHSQIADQVGAVLVVSPFGSPISRLEWDDFTKETNIPVIIDAAASFDAVHRLPSMQPGSTPLMISMHATKTFGIGEGGMILTNNTDLIERIHGFSNFGFNTSRISNSLGINTKMSEYQAAIGLAVLDSWQETRQQRLTVTENYLSLFNRLGLQPWMSRDWLSSTCNVLLPAGAQEARDHMLENNIESRVWWGRGCHTFPAYESLAKELSLPNTYTLSNTMLGLPFSIDTTQEQINIIGDVLNEFLNVQKLAMPEKEFAT